jgi:hypothetical protein
MNKIPQIILFTFLFCINSLFAATLDQEIEAETSALSGNTELVVNASATLWKWKNLLYYFSYL